MSILRPARKYDPLTPEQREAAWRFAFTQSLDELPDSEIAWERDMWRALGGFALAAIADELTAARQRDDFSLPGGADAAGLGRLLSRVNTCAVMRLVEAEALCLTAAMRTVFWAGLREVPR